MYVASAAALGTLSIAFFNAFLIWRQHAADRRSRRALFGVALRLQAVSDLIRKSEGKEGLGKGSPKRARETLRLSAASGDKSSEDLREYVMTRVFVDGERLTLDDQDALTAAIGRVDEAIDAWVEEPRRLKLGAMRQAIDLEAAKIVEAIEAATKE